MGLSQRLLQGLMLRMILVLVFVVGGTLWLTVETTRDYLHHQLASHAHDTANALGLALQQPLAAGDLMTANTMITALLQSGYYTAITLRDSDGTTLIQQNSDNVRLSLPDSFLTLLSLQPAPAKVSITNGWKEAATLEVASHPALAYQQLWRVALGILGLGLAGIALIGALCWQWTRRNQRIVNAQITTLRRQALQDELTGLGNRRAFDQHVLQLPENQPAPLSGHLLLVHLSSLGAVARSLGHWAANDYMETMVALLRQRVPSHPRDPQADHSQQTDKAPQANADTPVTNNSYVDYYRIGANEVALLCTASSREEVCAYAEILCNEFATLTTDIYPHGVGHIGITPFKAEQMPQEIIANGDMALCQAQHAGNNQWYYLNDTTRDAQPLRDLVST